MAHGAILTRNSNFATSPSVNYTLSWDNADEFKSVFFDPLFPTRLTVPVGVTEVELFVNAFAGSGSRGASDTYWQVFKNGSFLCVILHDNQWYAPAGFRSGAVEVIAGDYFELKYIHWGTGSPIFEKETFRFGITSLERYGFVEGRRTTTFPLSGTVTGVSWDDITLDTLSSFDGSTGFVVPNNVNYAVVSFDAYASSFTSGDLITRLTVNGVIITMYSDNISSWTPGPPCLGLVAVVPGDVVKIEVTGPVPIDVWVGIEWIYG